MRLPKLSASIDRRRPGTSPAGSASGVIRPQSSQDLCSGTCDTANPCENPGICECNTLGQCVSRLAPPTPTPTPLPHRR